MYTITILDLATNLPEKVIGANEVNLARSHQYGYHTLRIESYGYESPTTLLFDRLTVHSWNGEELILEYTELFSGVGEGPKTKRIIIRTK